MLYERRELSPSQIIAMDYEQSRWFVARRQAGLMRACTSYWTAPCTGSARDAIADYGQLVGFQLSPTSLPTKGRLGTRRYTPFRHFRAETKFSGHARRVYSNNGRQGYNPRARGIGCRRTTHGVRLTCAKNKGERGCVGGGGRVELGDDELLDTCEEA